LSAHNGWNRNPYPHVAAVTAVAATLIRSYADVADAFGDLARLQHDPLHTARAVGSAAEARALRHELQVPHAQAHARARRGVRARARACVCVCV
jgi:hypothetical protein